MTYYIFKRKKQLLINISKNIILKHDGKFYMAILKKAIKSKIDAEFSSILTLKYFEFCFMVVPDILFKL